ASQLAVRQRSQMQAPFPVAHVVAQDLDNAVPLRAPNLDRAIVARGCEASVGKAGYCADGTAMRDNRQRELLQRASSGFHGVRLGWTVAPTSLLNAFERKGCRPLNDLGRSHQ